MADRDKIIPWADIKQEFITTEINQSQLARKYGITNQAISKRKIAEGWEEEKRRWLERVEIATHARLAEQAVEAKVTLHQKAVEAAEGIINQILEASANHGLYKHLVQMEQVNGLQKRKWAESVQLDAINARAASDAARALKDLIPMVRTVEGTIDAATATKLDIERERLELDKRKAGMSDDLEQESGIALMPAVDDSLLADALPDPDQPELSSGGDDDA